MSTKPKFDGKRPRTHTAQDSLCGLSAFIPMSNPRTPKDIAVLVGIFESNARTWAEVWPLIPTAEVGDRHDQQEHRDAQ